MRAFSFALLMLIFISCSKEIFNPKWVNQVSPSNFIVRFETTKGNFEIQIDRAASPKAVDRFYQLVTHHFYDNSIFYRVIPNSLVQLGSSNISLIHQWSKFKVPDEKVSLSNEKGRISFARNEKETRGNDLFINLRNNLKYDTLNYEGVIGFPAFGSVIKGMEVVESIYSGYEEEPLNKIDTLYLRPAIFLKIYPKLDVIKKVRVLKHN
jgi:peptidyl-prolyl cis-trans isomerase A (cyclophilin A)